MNDSFERIKALLTGIGLTFEENGINSAEIKAYGKGLELCESEIDNVASQIRARSEYIKNSKMLDYTEENFEKAFSTLGGTYELEDKTITFTNCDIAKIGEFVKAWVFPWTKVVCSSNGFTWDELEKIGNCWRENDAKQLRWTMIETL
jgi:hypothetical protein